MWRLLIPIGEAVLAGFNWLMRSGVIRSKIFLLTVSILGLFVGQSTGCYRAGVEKTAGVVLGNMDGPWRHGYTVDLSAYVNDLSWLNYAMPVSETFDLLLIYLNLLLGLITYRLMKLYIPGK
jgi:hypothetical protein